VISLWWAVLFWLSINPSFLRRGVWVDDLPKPRFDAAQEVAALVSVV